jgi:hypothetical protein
MRALKLIDFAGQQIFETATVDVCIILIEKTSADSNHQTDACIIKEKRLDNLTDYIRQSGTHISFPNDGKSWVILSDIEQRIKDKVEKIGIPLKDWDINIYRGILTGCNEAFIIDKDKRDELIKKSPNSAEIIRPILRGRDIGRYQSNFANLYLINTHNGIPGKKIPAIDVKKYPSIKNHLDKYWDKISKREDRGATPYNLRSCAYTEDFSKQKIIYPDIMRLPTKKEALDSYPYFYFDKNGFYAEATNFILTGEYADIIFLFLVSNIGFYIFSKFYSGPQFDGTGFRYKKEYLNNLFIPKLESNDITALRKFLIKNSSFKIDNIKELDNISEMIFKRCNWIKHGGI